MKIYFLHDTEAQKRTRHPDPSTGFPAKWGLSDSITPPDLEGNLAYLEVLEKPSYDSETQVLEPFNDYTAKTEGWTVRDKTEEELKPPVPEEVSSWQIRVVAKMTPYGQGTLHDAIVAALNALTGLEKIAAEEIYFGGNKMYRNSTLLTQLALGLGLTDDELDELFIQADKINP